MVVHELVDRHQFDGGDAKALEVLDHLGVRHPGVGAPLVGRHLGVTRGEATHVGLVNHRVVPGRPGTVVVGPVEGRVQHYGLGHGRGRIGLVQDAVVAAGQRVAVNGLAPVHFTRYRPGVGVEQELGVIGAQAL